MHKINLMKHKLIFVFIILWSTLSSQEVLNDGFIDCNSWSDSIDFSNKKKLEVKIDSLILHGEFEQAINYLNCLLKFDSLNPALYYTRAAIKSPLLYNDTSFFQDYKKAISIDTDYLNAYYNLGGEYYNLLDTNDSYSHIPKDTLLYKVCDLYINNSIKYFEKVLEIDSSEFFNLKTVLYELYQKKGLVGKAERINNLNYQIPSDTDSLNIPRNPKAYYFPIEFLIDTINEPLYQVSEEQLLADREYLAHFKNSHYSQHLFSLKEPIIYNDYFNVETYRFTWLRSFHQPIVCRLVHSADQNTLIVKMSNGKGGYGPGEITVENCIILSEKEWRQFEKIINQIDFWNQSTIEKTDIIGADGADWILEGFKDKKYHVVVRWSGKEKEISKACLYLLELSELTINEIY